jgi:exosome complex exonuclease DIS3/RRP44
MVFARRHMPPPRANFEKLQDILQKRKGLTLDVSSSGALATSLDKCLVRFNWFFS